MAIPGTAMYISPGQTTRSRLAPSVVTALPSEMVKLLYQEPAGESFPSKLRFTSIKADPSFGSMVDSCSVHAPAYQMRLRRLLELWK